MKISTGNFGGADIQLQTGGASVPMADATGQALQNLGNAGELAGTAIQAVDKQKRDQLNLVGRADASNALLDHEINVKTLSQDVKTKLSTGELKYADAPAYYQEQASKFPTYTPDPSDPVTVENYNRGVKRLNFGASVDVATAANVQMKSDYKASGDALLDKLGKLGGMPGADIEAINKQADNYREIAKHAGIPDDIVDKKIQDFKDTQWFNQAQNMQLMYSDSKESLTTLKGALNDNGGFYTDKVDPDKRIALSKSIDGRIEQLDKREEVASNRREAKGKIAADQLEKQISSGIPGTPQQYIEWQVATKGTAYEPAFQDALKSELDVQKMLRMPMAEQATFIQEKRQQQATQGASLTDQANLNRLSNAFDANQKLLKETPLVFNQNTTGVATEPLALNNISTPDGMEAITNQLHDRFITVNAMRKANGPETALNPFLPQESEAIKAIIGKQSTGQEDINTKMAIIGMVAKSSPDALSYAGALKAISSDKPIIQVAGMAAYRDLKTTAGRNVAQTLLQGDKILADKSVPMPSEQAFASSFSDLVGDSMPQGSPSREAAYTAFKAAYAGMASDFGVHHVTGNLVPDDKLAKSAANVVTGGIYEYNGKKVIKPYGWADDKFDAAITTGLQATAKATGYNESVLGDMPLLPAGKEGVYYLQNGSTRLGDKEGKPVTIDITGMLK